MNCPSCTAGIIRMIPGPHCECGHPFMVCDGCRNAFMVKHDEKNQGLLPPEAEIEDCGPFWSEDMMFIREMKIMSGVPLTPEPVPTDLPTVEEMHTLIQIFDGMPIADIYDMIPSLHEGLNEMLSEGKTLNEQEQLWFDTIDRWIKASFSV